MKLLKIVAGLAVLAVFGLAAYSYYYINTLLFEVNKKRTEAARAARWKDKEGETETVNDESNETEKQI